MDGSTIFLGILYIIGIVLFTIVTLPFRILLFPILMIVRTKARHKTDGLTQELDGINNEISDTTNKMQALTNQMKGETEKYKEEKKSLYATDKEYNDRLTYYRSYFLALNDEWHFEEQTEEEKQEAKTAISYLSDSNAKNAREKLYNVVLQDSGIRMGYVIKIIREFSGLNFEETKKAVENRGIVLKNLSKAKAEAALAKLKEAGAIAIIQEKF